MCNFKKKSLKLALALCMVASLIGCKKDEPEEPVYELTAYTSENLQSGNYFVKSGESYYLVSPGTMHYESGGGVIPRNVNDERMVWFADDEVTIPTLYQEDELIYVTNNTVPNNFIWERYEDLGYTIGVRGLEKTESGRYTFTKKDSSLQPISSAFDCLNTVTNDTIVNIDKLDGVVVNESNVSRGGTVMNLSQGKVYSVDVYLGTQYQEMQIEADTRAFIPFELYETNEYQLSQEGYASITIPSYFKSGYYYINGMGMFKYVAASRLDENPNINYNEAYYLGYDEDGNMITSDDLSIDSSTDNDESSDEQKFIWTDTILLDCNQKEMTVSVTYSDIINIVNGQKVSLKSDEDAINPTAVICDPEGKEYELDADTRSENTLSISLENPLTGEWVLKMTEMQDRTFDVKTEFASGHSDNLVHTGNGKSKMTVYLPQNLIDGIFMFTWENTGRAADIIVTTPTGENFGKSINTSDLISEGYGYLDLRLGDCVSGNYEITVSGEDLGRVRFTYKENYIPTDTQPLEESQENTNPDTDIEQSNSQTNNAQTGNTDEPINEPSTDNSDLNIITGTK